MKKTLLAICILFAGNRIFAQITTDPSGNVGIGTTTPNAKLDVRKAIVTNGISTLTIMGYGGTTQNRSFSFQQLGNVNTATQYFFMNGGLGSSSLIGSPTLTSTYTPTFGFESNDVNMNIIVAPLGTNVAVNRAMTFVGNGNIGIGTTNPGTNKLAVEGTISARKVVVTTTNPFPDYVFKKEYKLRPLSEVAKYIRDNSHLPEVPSAWNVEKNGLDLGGNQEVLLKKIEELTLYAIEQQRRLERLEKHNARIEAQLKKALKK